MAGKKNKALVAVIDGLTATQAANIQGDIAKSKNRHAPHARAISTTGSREDVGKHLSAGHDAVRKIEKKGK